MGADPEEGLVGQFPAARGGRGQRAGPEGQEGSWVVQERAGPGSYTPLPTSPSARVLQDKVLYGPGLAFQQLRVGGKVLVPEVPGTFPAVVLMIAGIPVTVDANTTFPAGQTCGMLAPNQRVEVRGMLTISGGTLSVVATMIEIEDGSEGEGEGRVTEVSGTCPNLTITVDGLSLIHISEPTKPY